METQLKDQIRQKVMEGYRAIALTQPQAEATSCCSGTSCCGPDNSEVANRLAEKIGYDPAALAALPEGANLGLSCGNPTALAGLREGEVVLDLGSGGGFDVFLAGRQVGASGRAIGVDMTAEMISKARQNALRYVERTGLDNVEFRLGEIEHLPLADQSVDVVISNCVINLSPDKPQVWREIARVLRPGGRVAVSDLSLLKPLPEEIAGLVEALIGCIAGASLVEEVRSHAEQSGLTEICLETKPQYVDAMMESGDPLYQRLRDALPAGDTVADYVVSLSISARKPSA